MLRVWSAFSFGVLDFAKLTAHITNNFIYGTGHTENEQSLSIGSPVERVLAVAVAMLECASTVRLPDNSTLQVRIGELL